MELIRRNSDYAFRSLVYMAGFPQGKIFSVKAIAKKENVPIAFLRKILQRLSLNKIVDSQRGPQGGYYLLRRAQDISIGEILESVQGRISLSDCILENNLCSRRDSCRIKQGLSDIQKKLISLFDKYTLRDFLAER